MTDPVPLIPDPAPGETPHAYSARLVALHDEIATRVHALQPARDARLERARAARAAVDAAVALARATVQQAEQALSAAGDAELRAAADAAHHEWMALQQPRDAAIQAAHDAFETAMAGRELLIELGTLVQNIRFTALSSAHPDDDARWDEIRTLLHDARPRLAELAATALADDPVPAAPAPEWTDAARARLALAAAAADLADAAAVLVGTAREDDRASSLRHLTRIEEIAGAVVEVRKLAVIHAREQAMPWERIGEALGVTRQTAHARFGAVVEEWHDVLYDPDKQGWAWMPEGAYDPAATAATLERWLARRHHDDGPAPTVSAGLPRYDPMTRARETLARANWLTSRISAGAEVSPAAKADHHRRKDTALTAIAEVQAAETSHTEEDQP